jgi:TRAP-type C4-dicarboxylate transport system permease small subunit
VAEKEDAHLGISFFSVPSPFFKKIMHAVRISGKGIFFSTLTVYGFRMSYHSFMRGEMTPFGIPAWSFTLAVPVAGLLVLTRLALSEILRGDSSTLQSYWPFSVLLSSC